MAHNIAIVTFSDGSQTVCGLTSIANATTLKGYVNNLGTGVLLTDAAGGMEKAASIISGVTRVSNKVAVLFTDGAPNGWDWSIGTFDTGNANSAISYGLSIKNAGGYVYSIGMFDSTDSASENVQKYMNYVSSNYRYSSSLTGPGTGEWNGNYYKMANDSDSLNEIFQTISNNIQSGSATIPLDTTTIVQDTVSEYFDLPENTTDVKVYTAEAIRYRRLA